MSLLQKLAMAVPLPEDIRKRMMDQGVMALLKANPELPSMGKEKIRGIIDDLKATGANEFLSNLGAKTVLELPYIMKANPENMVEIDGKSYYIVSVEESGVAGKKRTIRDVEYAKGQKFPGEVIAMDVETGAPVAFDFDDIKDKIRVPSHLREQSLNEINEEIKAWNEKLDAIGSAAGPTRLNLQVRAVEDRIQKRIDSLSGMEEWYKQAINDPVHIAPAYGEWMEFLKNNYNTFGIRDIFDTLLFLYQSDAQGLINKIKANEVAVPEEIKPALLGLAAQEASLREEKMSKERADFEAREEAKEAPLPESKEVKEEKIVPYSLENIPEKKYKTPSKYKTLYTWAASLKRSLAGVQRNKKELEDIVNTFSGLRGYIAGISKSTAYLTSPEGAESINDIKRFLDAAQVFLKGYKENIIVDGKIDPSLLGREGTVGNALIAVRLYSIYNVVRRAIDQVSAKEIVPQEKTPVTPQVPTPIASAKDKIKRMAELLWKAFEDRMKIR